MKTIDEIKANRKEAFEKKFLEVMYQDDGYSEELEKLGEINNETIDLVWEEAMKEVEKLVGTHTEHEGRYCDTGEDMEWACRSECVELALKRLRTLRSTTNGEDDNKTTDSRSRS